MAGYDGVDILALEAAAALAANMSYGKWKAMGGKITPGENIPLPKGWQTCEQCGKPFRPRKGYRQKYCGAACRIETNKIRFVDKRREYAREYRKKQKAMAAE